VKLPPPLRFTEADADAAAEAWGFNCGPAAVCAVTGMTPAEIRPYLLEFETKRYTNPRLMFAILRGLGVQWRARKDPLWPEFGLVRVQWAGPWTQPGVPIRARYRHTHWIATCLRVSRGIFDVNCMNSGGWVRLEDWATVVVPHLLRACEPRASGVWWKTHCLEIDPETLPASGLATEGGTCVRF
jgi:hypothetical protein